MINATLRSFTKSDWAGFSGAFPIGAEGPYIAEIAGAEMEPVVVISEDEDCIGAAAVEVLYGNGDSFLTKMPRSLQIANITAAQTLLGMLELPTVTSHRGWDRIN